MGSSCCSKTSTVSVAPSSRMTTIVPLTRSNTGVYRRSVLVLSEETESTFYEMSARNREQPLIHWKRGELIGEGAFAKVYQGLNTETGELVAAKHFEFNGDTRKVLREYQSLKREIQLLRALDHPNIVKYLQADISPDQESIDVVLEFVPGGSIQKLLGQYKGLAESVVSTFTYQLLSGLHYLHDHGVIHRDLKCANLLLDATGTVKITDFGASKRIESDQDRKLTRSLKGSPYWMAPEIVLKRGHSFAADIWSLGCVVIEMVTGKAPWSDFSQEAGEVLRLIAQAGSTCYADIPKIPSCSPRLQSFLRSCLQRNPLLRPNAAQLLTHPFVCELKTHKQSLCSTGQSSESPVFESSLPTIRPVLTDPK